MLYDKVQEAEKKEEESTADYVSPSWVVLEEEARTTTRENMEDYFDLMNDLERKTGLTSTSMLSFCNLTHTNYFNPDDKDRFDMNMSGKFEESVHDFLKEISRSRWLISSLVDRLA